MEATTCIQIPEGTDLNEIFKSLHKTEIENNKPLIVPDLERPKTYVTPMQREVLKNKILSAILDKIEPIDFAEQFSMRKNDPMERYVRLELISKIRVQKEKAKDVHQSWSQIKEEKKFSPNISKKIIYVIENVVELADKIGSGIVVRAGIIYLYDGKKWKPVARELIDAFIEMAAERLSMDVDDAKTAKFRSIFREQLNTSAVLPDIYDDSDKDVKICLNNGVFIFDGQNISSGKHDKELYFTYCLDFDYDENATCPNFQQYLDKVLPDKEQQDLLQEYLGYCLSGDFLKHEQALILYGPLGSGGKSVLHDCLELMFKRQLMSNYSMSDLSDEKKWYDIQHKLINYSSEIDFSRANMEIFKQLTSCETVSVRRLFHMPAEVRLTAKHIFNANLLPDNNLSDSLFRRLIILPFVTVIKAEEANIHLAKELAADEASGIFKWMVTGLKRLTDRGRFDIPLSVQQAVNQYKHESVNINIFLDEGGWIPSDNNKDKVKLLDFYKKYKEFTIAYNYKPFNSNNFASHLRKMGFQVRKSNQNKTYVWCKQKIDPEELTCTSIF